MHRLRRRKSVWIHVIERPEHSHIHHTRHFYIWWNALLSDVNWDLSRGRQREWKRERERLGEKNCGERCEWMFIYFLYVYANWIRNDSVCQTRAKEWNKSKKMADKSEEQKKNTHKSKPNKPLYFHLIDLTCRKHTRPHSHTNKTKTKCRNCMDKWLI